MQVFGVNLLEQKKVPMKDQTFISWSHLVAGPWSCNILDIKSLSGLFFKICLMWPAINSILWIEVKSLHVSGRPQVFDYMPSVLGLEHCSIICMHCNGPRTFLDSLTLIDLKSSNLGQPSRCERHVGVLRQLGVGTFLQLPMGAPPFAFIQKFYNSSRIPLFLLWKSEHVTYPPVTWHLWRRLNQNLKDICLAFSIYNMLSAVPWDYWISCLII